MSGLKGRLLLIAVAVTGSALVAAGCGSSSSSSDSSKLASKDKQVLSYNLAGDPQGFDPAKASYLETITPLIQHYAPLYRLEGDKSELTPFLADGLPEVSKDGLTYTVKMRTDAKWSDGTPITASDAVWAQQYGLDPKTAAPFATFSDPIVGATDYYSGTGKWDAVGIKATDDHTIVYTLNKVTPWFGYVLSLQTFWPLPKAYMDKMGANWADSSAVAKIPASGPFKFASYKRKKELAFVKNPAYWDAKDVKLQRITMPMIAQQSTARKLFQQGSLDTGMPGTMIPIPEVAKWKSTKQFRSEPTASTSYVWFNTTNKVLSDPKVRQGLSIAIDRDAIVNNITKKGDIPLNTIIPTNMPGYDVIKEGAQDFIGAGEKPDLDKAKQLLSEGGWKEGTSLSMYFNSESATAPLIAQSMQSDWAKIGVNLKLVPTPSAQLQEAGIGSSPIDSKVDITMTGWSQDYPDAQDFYQFFQTASIKGGLNNANWSSPDFDKAYNQAITTQDTDARTEQYKNLEAMLTGPDGAMPNAPLYQPTDITLVQDWVKGIELTPGGIQYFDPVKIQEH